MLTKIGQYILSRLGTSTAKSMLKNRDATIKDMESLIKELSSDVAVLNNVIEENEALKDSSYAFIAMQGQEIKRLQLELDKCKYDR